ncbi:MAG: 5-formyltetrahydrofolate cyclo-ligase [Trueperaceae bacterium]
MHSASPDSPDRPTAGASKQVWRKWARARRRAAGHAQLGRSISAQLEAWPVYRAVLHVLIYVAFGDEPDLSALLAQTEKTFYATRTVDPGMVSEGVDDRVLTLHRLEPGTLEAGVLERHRFGFLQPSSLTPPVTSGVIELVLVPGLAFDMRGNRLGFGKGYYDRLLGKLDSSVPRVGIAPAELLVPSLPTEEHDVRMTHLATEEGILPVADV